MSSRESWVEIIFVIRANQTTNSKNFKNSPNRSRTGHKPKTFQVTPVCDPYLKIPSGFPPRPRRRIFEIQCQVKNGNLEWAPLNFCNFFRRSTSKSNFRMVLSWTLLRLKGTICKAEIFPQKLSYSTLTTELLNILLVWHKSLWRVIFYPPVDLGHFPSL